MRRELREPAPAVLIVAAMWRPGIEGGAVEAELEAAFEPIETRSPEFEVTQTSYYESEMGRGLRKRFFGLAGLHPRDQLVEYKLCAAELEARHLTDDGRRVLNVDPMLLTAENLVIATWKNFPHRVYLGQGVFGDVALARKKGGFEPFHWTYKDYLEQLPFFEQEYRRLSARPASREPAE